MLNGMGQKSSAIVMLTQLVKGDRCVCIQYNVHVVYWLLIYCFYKEMCVPMRAGPELSYIIHNIHVLW